MNLKHEHQDTYDNTFLYVTYRIYFSHNHHVEKSTVKVYISLSVFITVRTSYKKVKQVAQTHEEAELFYEKLTPSLWQAM
jgi:hypothetical protein